MTRRRFIALVSLCVLVALGAVGLSAGWYLLRSAHGQQLLRRWIEQRVASAIDGRLYIGRVDGNLFTGLTVDSLEIRDREDSLFVATGRLTVSYDPRDLLDRRLYLRRVDVEHPQVVLRQHESWRWNFKQIFRVGRRPHVRRGPQRGFGDFVVLDSVHVRRGGAFRLTIPWHPDDSLHGSRRDSAVRANLSRRDHEIRRVRDGFTQTYRWTNIAAVVPHLRLAHPDSADLLFEVDTVHADESVPDFRWRNVRGTVRLRGDTAWVVAPHWDLAGSTGRAAGRVVWGSDLPVRYDMTIVGDSVSLADVGWVYPTLPRSGRGRLVLEIRNERDLHLLDYVIRDMDVTTTRSRLRGQMTFEIGGPVLGVHDVKLEAAPVDFDLLRTLNGQPFPADWQGTLTGRVVARGGPVTHFRVDAADLVFHDRHVPGAVSRASGRGELDILFPAFTAFHRFSVASPGIDLRTLAAIYPAFPRVKGRVSGTAVLDSSWLDVRVSQADLTHTDGPGEPSHATGGGRITYGIPFLRYDLALQVSPLSVTTLARSYRALPLRGRFVGPLRIRGVAPTLEVEGDLTGPAGRIVYAGRVDADSLGGYGAHGRGTVTALDIAPLFGRAAPVTALDGDYAVDLVGDSLATLDGAVALRLDRSTAAGIELRGGVLRGRFARGLLHVDSLRLAGSAGRLLGAGTLGLTRGDERDSLAFRATIDSLGALRRALAPVRTAAGAGATPLDSVAGTVTVQGIARGRLDSLSVEGELTGRNLRFRTDHLRSVTGAVRLRTRGEHVDGRLRLRADSARLAGVRVDELSADASLLARDQARFAFDARSEETRLRATGGWRGSGDSVRVVLDTLGLTLPESRWTLLAPVVVGRAAGALTVDTLVLANDRGSRLAGSLRAPVDAPVQGRLRAERVPLRDLGSLARLPSAVGGELTLDLAITGSRARPILSLDAAARDVRYAGVEGEAIAVRGRYADERADVSADLLSGGRSVLAASVAYPIALTLFSARPTGDSLRGRLKTDSVDLALVEALSPRLRHAAGRLALDLALRGRTDRLHVDGSVTVRDGRFELPEAGVRIEGLEGRVMVDAARDSLSISHLRWTSPGSGGAATLQGSVVFRELSNPRLDLRLDARGFRALDRRGLARLDVSTGAGGLSLAGTPEAATLRGDVTVDRGTIFIPELVRKQLVDLTPEEFAQLFDTTDVRNRSLMPQPPGALLEHLGVEGVSVRLGDDVWLRSREASIKLGGSLDVTRARAPQAFSPSRVTPGVRADSAARYALALSGTLSADRGTYTLDLTAVQREFQVESGRITFFGTPDFNPQIDVTALYRVKQATRSDIGIRARIHGNFFPQPALELTSTDAYLSPSDLVSYLVAGRPSAELIDQNAQRTLEFVLPTLSASVNRALRDQLGGLVDLVQIQTGTLSDPLRPGGTANSSQFRNLLSSTRLGGEKQISDRLFLSFSAGLCQFGQFGAGTDATQQGLNGFVNAIEGKVEYRFPLLAPDRLSFRAGREPAASGRCDRDVRGFVATPQQWGLSLLRSWSF